MDDELLKKRRLNSQRSKEEEESDDYILLVYAVKNALEILIKELHSYAAPEPGKVELIMYFDEAHPLTRLTPIAADEKTSYDFLCSCLNQFSIFPVFFIFLSTNSSLAHFAGPQALAKSARIRRGNATTHAPITETPFDCSKELMVKPGKLSMEDISKIPFMAQFGRPL